MAEIKHFKGGKEKYIQRETLREGVEPVPQLSLHMGREKEI